MTRDETTGEVQLTLKNVTQSYGDVLVLDGVSLAVHGGSVTCLVGPNGSGKTTLLSIAAGLLDPDEGGVERPTGVDRAVGYVPQQPSFRPQFTVAETIQYYAGLVPTSIDAEATLARVGLDDVANRRVEHLSGGMMRLLALAQATVGSPPLLVLDEPASGLDPQIRRHIADAIDDLASDGTGVLLATHDLRATERIGDRMLVLDDGHFLAEGSPTSLRRETGTDTLDDALDVLIDREDVMRVRSGTGGERA